MTTSEMNVTYTCRCIFSNFTSLFPGNAYILLGWSNWGLHQLVLIVLQHTIKFYKTKLVATYCCIKGNNRANKKSASACNEHNFRAGRVFCFFCIDSVIDYILCN